MQDSKARRRKNLGVWIFILACVCASIALGVGLTWWEDFAHPVLWRGYIRGTGGEATLGEWHKPSEGHIQPGETQELEISLTASEKERFLQVEPGLQRCQGLPTLNIDVRLENANAKVVAQTFPDNAFKGSGGSENCRYWRQVPFKSPASGIYTLYITPYNWGISGITITVRGQR